MRLYSTPESVLKGEITVLAICETVFCVVLYFVVETVWHPGLLPWAVLVAPLFLARTQQSMRLDIHGYETLFLFTRYMFNYGSDSEKAKVFLFFLIFPLIGVSFRIWSTVSCVFAHPVETLTSTPGNWVRQVLATDFRHPPEIVPGEIQSRYAVNFTRIVHSVKKHERWKGLSLIAITSTYFIFGWIPALVYRITFKATSLVYAPFVWVAHITFRNPLQLKDRLERITKGELEKVRRWYSWLLLTFLPPKLALYLGFVDLAWVAKELDLPNLQLAEAVIQPNAFPWWQLALIGDAVLTILLLLFADAATPRIDEEKRVWKDGWVSNTVSSVSFIRAVLAFLVMAHGFYFAWQRVDFSKVVRLFAS